MAWTGLTLTVEGQNALNKAQLSNKMNIKSIVVGDGKTPQNFRTRKGLVNQLYEITELKIDMNADGCVITADFPKVDYDYYFREIGVIITTESDGEKLYVYDNCGDDAQYIVSSTGAEDIKKRMRLSLTISGVAEITVSNPNILYVAYDDFENEIQMLHHTKVSSDGGDASELVVDFEHKELEPLSSGETLSVTLGKAAKAVADFIGHIENKSNPHEVTKSQVGLSNVPNVTTDDQAPTFTQASLRANISSGETLSVTLGKIMKWFADMKAAAFAGLANNCTTTVEGYALDARQGKALQDKVNEINSNIDTIKTNFRDGCSTIAAAITSQGVSTAANASPATMASNIKTACTNKYNAGVAAGKPTVRSLGSKSVSFGESGGSGTVVFALNSGEYLQITSVSFNSASGRGDKGSDKYSLSVSGGTVTISMSISGGGGTSGSCTVTANAIS